MQKPEIRLFTCADCKHGQVMEFGRIYCKRSQVIKKDFEWSICKSFMKEV